MSIRSTMLYAVIFLANFSMNEGVERWMNY